MGTVADCAVMERNWTEVGSKYTADRHDEFVKYFDGLEWESMPISDAPMCQGLALKAAMKELRTPKVSRVSFHSTDMSPYCLLGIEANYSNGRALVYLLDLGTSVVVLCSDFYPKGGAV